ncbi:MAG: phosphotransferase family protein [Desulfomicrobium sp.]
MNWANFFPEDSRVLAIPDWNRPRLFVAAQPLGVRWKASTLFPATTLPARVRRWLLRGLAQFWSRTRQSQDLYILQPILSEIWNHNVQPVAALLGTPGPTQKLVVQFADPSGNAVGYMKFGESPATMRRLKQEFEVLSALPKGMGPEALKLEKIGNGLGLFLSALQGRPLSGRVAPSAQTMALLHKFQRSAEPIPVHDHPWMQRALITDPDAAFCISMLDSRPWSMTIIHGDLAPWNILTSPHGLRCIDWEYGALDGFIGVDAAHHFLQTAYLLKGWTPEKARQKTTDWLSQKMGFKLREAEAVVRLSALMARHESLKDGHAADAHLQMWRYKIWGESCV